MTTYFTIYTPGRKQRSWRWGRRTAVIVVYGPEDQLRAWAKQPHLSKVGSRAYPNLDYYEVAEVDGRYWGPRSRAGQAYDDACQWARDLGFRPLLRKAA